MARKCSTALVAAAGGHDRRPPRSPRLLRVTMSRGLRSCFTASTSTLRRRARCLATFSSCDVGHRWRSRAATGPAPRTPMLIVLAVYMPPQEPLPGIARLLDLAEIFLAHLAGGELAHRLEHADDVEVLALVAPGQDGAAVDVDRRHVGAQHAHHAAGHVFVAAADDEHAVHPLAADAGLDAVGDDFARHQRCTSCPRCPSPSRRRSSACRRPAGWRRPP